MRQTWFALASHSTRSGPLSIVILHTVATIVRIRRSSGASCDTRFSAIARQRIRSRRDRASSSFQASSVSSFIRGAFSNCGEMLVSFSLRRSIGRPNHLARFASKPAFSVRSTKAKRPRRAMASFTRVASCRSSMKSSSGNQRMGRKQHAQRLIVGLSGNFLYRKEFHERPSCIFQAGAPLARAV